MTIKENKLVFKKSCLSTLHLPKETPHAVERNGAELFLGDRKQAGAARGLEESECHAPVAITETCFVPALVSVWFHT